MRIIGGRPRREETDPGHLRRLLRLGRDRRHEEAEDQPAFEVYVQQLVLDEAAAGDPVATGLIAASHEAMGFVAPTRQKFNLTSEVNSGILIETRSFCGCPPPVRSAKGAGDPRSGRCPRSR